MHFSISHAHKSFFSQPHSKEIVVKYFAPVYEKIMKQREPEATDNYQLQSGGWGGGGDCNRVENDNTHLNGKHGSNGKSRDNAQLSLLSVVAGDISFHFFLSPFGETVHWDKGCIANIEMVIFI